MGTSSGSAVSSLPAFGLVPGHAAHAIEIPLATGTTYYVSVGKGNDENP
ncbi:hypothetical protein [Alloscardovia macacae]|nr:hypothetical protein [Alloscardovia macacae]